jgi:peptide deformylase
LLKLEEELLKTNGIGLSAIQIGIPKQVSIIKSGKGELVSIINPVILEQEDEFVFMGEGCLSFPGIYCKSKRFEHFVIINRVIDGNCFRSETQYYHCNGHGKDNSLVDYEALAAQHEIDHHNGKIIIDYGFDKYEVSQRNIDSIGETVKAIDKKIGRNDLCPCNSGKKYKKCCLGKII